jgi:lipopolysaccharide transport system ATP-binding protein
MSSEPVIEVKGMGKAYPVYDKPHHRLMQMLAPGNRRWYREFDALCGIDFSVHRGETLGIVGRNGSGKSTLLQILCGTLAPSTGDVSVRGRVAALLELGAGFNPEFSGRENVYLNGSVLGLTRSEIDDRFDEIASFADIGEFIEQPVKNYSSGMYIRLAFAVAINVMPDILVIDEALSVGDEAFQRKCYARINTIRDAGATVLFVSHSAGTVLELCDRAILLDRGELLMQGTPKAVVSSYHKLLYTSADKAAEVRESIRQQTDLLVNDVASSNRPARNGEKKVLTADTDDGSYLDEGMLPQSTLRYQSRGAFIDDARIETLQGRRVNVLRHGGEYVYAYRVAFQSAAASVRFGMMIKTVTGLELGGATNVPAGMSECAVAHGQMYDVHFRFRAMLAAGTYFLNAGVSALDLDGETYLDRLIDVAMFRVMPDAYRIMTGMVDFNVESAVSVCAVDEVQQ